MNSKESIKFKDSVKENWGFVLFVILSFISLFSLISKGGSGHYDFFSGAARDLWTSKNPYLIEYPSGFFNYSPLCGLLFYAPFAFLPYSLGLGLLSVFSLFTFIYGLKSLLRSLEISQNLSQWMWLLLINEVIGAILNVRIELFFAGVLLLSLARGEHYRWILLLLALITNFKLQAIAPVGLLFVALVFGKKNYRALKTYFVFLILCFLFPLLVIPKNLWGEVHSKWAQSMGGLIGEGFYSFQHIFSFFDRVWGFRISPDYAKVLSLGCALFLAIYVYAVSKKSHQNSRIMAYALGSGFVSVFSPASQSAAYIFSAPLFFEALRISWGYKARLMIVFIGWLLTSGLYSDLFGQSVRHMAFDLALKPVGPLLLMGFIIYCSRKVLRSLI